MAIAVPSDSAFALRPPSSVQDVTIAKTIGWLTVKVLKVQSNDSSRLVTKHADADVTNHRAFARDRQADIQEATHAECG